MNTKRVVTLLLAAFLFSTCQESPTQSGHVNNESVLSNEQGPSRIANDFGNAEGFEDPNDCLDDPFAIDCDPGGGGPGGGNGSILPVRFQYVNRGNTYASLYTSVSVNGINGWSTSSFQGPAANAESSNTPALVKFQDKLYVFYNDHQSTNIRYAFSLNGNDWFGNSILNNNASGSKAPVATVHDGKIYVYALDFQGVTPKVSTSSNGTSFTQSVSTKDENGNTIQCCGSINDNKESIGVASFRGKIYLFYRNNFTLQDPGRINYRTSTDGINFSAEKTIGRQSGFPVNAIPTATSGISTTVHQDKLYIAFASLFAQGDTTHTGFNVSKNVVVMRTDVNGGFTNGFFTGGDYSYTSFGTDQTPGIASDGNKIVVVYRDNNKDFNSFYYSPQPIPGGTTFPNSGFSAAGGNLRYMSSSSIATGRSRAGASLVYTGN